MDYKVVVMKDAEEDLGSYIKYLIIEPQPAINVNRETILDNFTQVMLEREALVLELLIQEGYFECGGKYCEKK